jgi:hypothetical protein
VKREDVDNDLAERRGQSPIARRGEYCGERRLGVVEYACREEAQELTQMTK